MLVAFWRDSVAASHIPSSRRFDALFDNRGSCPAVASGPRGHDSAVLGIAFAPNGRTVATAGSDETVRLWDVKTGRQTATLRGHKGPVVSVVFSPDGSTLCSWCYWRTKIMSGENKGNHSCATELKVWDVPMNKVRLTFEPDQPRTNSFRPLFVAQLSGNGEDLLTVTADHQGVDRFNLAKPN